ncbi:MAG: hypothetical protein RJA10_844 [Pseudomonadota bacterium]|jgi:hypothetical protein
MNPRVHVDPPGRAARSARARTFEADHLCIERGVDGVVLINGPTPERLSHAQHDD